MRAHPLLAVIIGWLIGSFFGLGQVMGLVKGFGAKPAAPAAAQNPAGAQLLLTAFVLIVIGFALGYSGIKSGDAWRKPWQPVADAIKPAGAGA